LYILVPYGLDRVIYGRACIGHVARA
jgi:hypothetical protein